MDIPNNPTEPQTQQDKSPQLHLRYKKQIVLCSLLAVLLASCLYRFCRHHYYVADPLVLSKTETNILRQPLILSDKINPNTATNSSLTRLPGIGPKKAQDIIQYREQYYKDRNDQSHPFSDAQDLQMIKGIGPKTAEKLKDYLVFE